MYKLDYQVGGEENQVGKEGKGRAKGREEGEGKKGKGKEKGKGREGKGREGQRKGEEG